MKSFASSRVACVLSYGLIWTFAFSFLWFLVNAGVGGWSHPGYFWSSLLALAWSTLCPSWPFFAMGALLGLLTCLCRTKLGSATKASLLWGLLPLGLIGAVFSFTTSGLRPALVSVVSSLLTGAIVAHAWPEDTILSSSPDRSFAARRVCLTSIWFLALSIPFRLFQGFAAAWSHGAEITETYSAPSPDGIYVAVVHNVDPGIGDYSDVIIRPRHTALDLFSEHSASSRYQGVERIQWTGNRTLRIWRDYDAGHEQRNDVAIEYIDTGSQQDKQERAALRQAVAGH